MEKKDKLLKLQDLTMYFFICSFIGWLLEVAYAFSVYGTFVDRGFLRGPICPIYGYGAVIMVLITDWIKKKKITNLLIIFAIVAVIATVLEYIASYFLELVFNLRWWDYTGYFLNINGRVCLIFSIFFGIAGVIFIKNIYPIMQKTFDKIRKKLSTKTIWIILITLIILMTLDKGISALLYIDPELKYVDRRVILQKFK
jgi:uncharacterized membrane protein